MDNNYVCVYLEGRTCEDDYRYTWNRWDIPKTKRFISEKEMNEWIEERSMDEETDPDRGSDGGYLFAIVYIGIEKECIFEGA